MKFDKETIIVLVIAALIMAGWFYLYPQYQAEQAEKLQQQKVEQLKNQNAIRQQKAEEAANVVPAVEKKTVVKETAAAGTEAAVKTIEEKAASVKETLPVAADMLKPVVLENKLVKFTFDPATGTLISTELKTFKKNVGSAEGENLILKPEGKVKRAFYAGDVLSAETKNVQVVPENDDSLVITRQLDSFKVEETFTLQPDSYTLDVTYKITNTSTQNRELKDKFK